MKKVFKIALGCICAASMMAGVACGDKGGNGYNEQETLGGKTAEEKYTEIMATIDEYNKNFTSNTEFDIRVDAKMAGQSVGWDMEMLSTVKMQGENFQEHDFIDGGTLQGMSLGTMSMDVWYVDGVAYVDGAASGNLSGSVPAKKVKYTATIAQICEIAGLDQETLWNPIYDFSDTAFEDVKFNVGENDAYFEIVMQGDEAAEYAEKVSVMQGVNGDISIPQVNYKFMLDTEGNFDYVKIDYEMTMVANVSGQSVTYKYQYDGKITFSDIGTTVVTVPTGSEDWTDLTAYLPSV